MYLNKVQDKIIEEFNSLFDQVKNKFQYFRHFAGLSKLLPSGAAIKKSGDNLIKFAKSVVWLDAEYKEGKVYYTAKSSSDIMDGILSLYTRVFSGRTPSEIIDSNIYFTNEILLPSYLPAERSNELSFVLLRMKAQAAKFKLLHFDNENSLAD